MKKTLALAGIGAMALMGLAAPSHADQHTASPATTSTSAVGHQPVTFCHRTASATNPYVVITTDANSIIRQGHDGHDKMGNGLGGDIIPPFEYEDGSYPGKNYDAAGQAILNAGCLVVTPTPTPTTTTTTPAPEPTTTTTTPAPEPTVTTTVPGPVVTVPGPVTTVPGAVVVKPGPGVAVRTAPPAAGAQRGFNSQTAAGESEVMGNTALISGIALLAGAAGLALYRRQAGRSH